jgi:AraC family transcriptional regulator
MQQSNINIIPEYRNGFFIFVSALDFIESNLLEDFSQEEIARACYCSLSSLQKTWKYVTHMSVKEYISKRRMTLASRELLETDSTVLDIAMKYRYNSHEVFTRAFKKVWGVSPSAFKREWKGSCELYPRLNPEYLEGAYKMNVKKFDIREFYDYLKSQAGTYVLCFDIQHLMVTNNELGSEAGDKVILEAFRRINEAAGEDILCLRMGGDEFVMITESTDASEVTAIAEKVLSQNGNKVPYSGGMVEVSLRCGVIVIGKSLKYSVLCDDLNKVLERARVSGKIEFIS